MATYRCPECGASHKDLVSHCRLCGAPIENPITVRNAVLDKSVAAERFAPKNVNHFIWIGLFIAALFVVGVFATGTVHNATLSRAWHKIPFVPEAVEDVWVEWDDPSQRMIVELPATPETPDDDQVLDLGAETQTWTTTLGDAEVFVGYTDDLNFEPTTDEEGNSLEESETTAAFTAAAEAMAEQQGGRLDAVGDIFRYDGSMAADLVIDGVSLQEGVAYGSVRMIMSDGEIYFAETIDYQPNSDTQKRIRSSIVVLADNPDATLPEAEG